MYFILFYILQRLTQANPLSRDSNIGAFIQNDVLGCAVAGIHQVTSAVILVLGGFYL